MSPMQSKSLIENYAEFYDDADLEWRRIGSVAKAKNIKSLCSEYPHARILEIGAGDGSVLQRLSEERFGQDLFAVEISQSGIQRIKEKNIPGLVEVKLFSGYDVPYPKDSFDLVILCHVLEHVEYPRQLIYEAGRVGRLVYVEVPLEDTARLPRDFILDRVGHINFYSPKSIRHLIQTCGMKVLSQKTTNRSRQSYIHQIGKRGLISYFVKDTLLKLLPWLAIHLFTYHEAIIFRKHEMPEPLSEK